MGRVYKSRNNKRGFFPKVHDKQKLKINITPIVTAMVTGHGKARAYLHRFKILEHENCPCGNGDQTIQHLLNRCSILHTQREIFKRNVLKSGNWPASKHEFNIEAPKIILTVYKIDKFLSTVRVLDIAYLFDLL